MGFWEEKGGDETHISFRCRGGEEGLEHGSALQSTGNSFLQGCWVGVAEIYDSAQVALEAPAVSEEQEGLRVGAAGGKVNVSRIIAVPKGS